jgi:type I restriction enzyme S subunit
MRADWETLILEDCMDAIIDYRGKSPKKTAAGVPLVTAKVIKNGRIDPPNEFIALKDFDAWMRRGMPKTGDVVITTEAPLGEVAQLDGRQVALAQRVITLRGKPGVLDNTFLKFLLQSSPVQDQLRARSTGTTVLGIKQSELRKVSLRLPPIAEQRAIATVLGALDDKIELNRCMNSTLDAMARALFQSWFVDFDPVRAKLDGQRPVGLDDATSDFFPAAFEPAASGRLPFDWTSAPIRDVCAINDWTLGKGDALEVLEYVEISEVNRGDIANLPSYSRAEAPSRARRRLRHGDTVISTVRPDRGSYFLALHPPEHRVVSTGFAVLTPTKAPWSFVFAAMTQPDVSEHLGQMADGGAYPAVSSGIVGNWSVALPNDSRILEAFHRICAPLLERAQANRSESRTLTALRDTLLPKLLSGELSVAGVEARL